MKRICLILIVSLVAFSANAITYSFTTADDIQSLIIDFASAGDIIELAEGSYVLTNGPIMLDSAFTIVGANRDTTIINAAANSRVFVATETGAMLDSLTITGGNYAGDGGGVLGYSLGITTLTNCMIVSNATTGSNNDGGGVSYATLFNCIVSNNSSQFRGGGADSCTISNSIIVGNSVLYSGGGLSYCDAYGTTVKDNYATAAGGGGGGVYGSGQDFIGGIIVSNKGYGGGGANAMNVDSSTIASNYCVGNGGGVYSCTGTNLVISNNFATGSGGGAYVSTLTNATVVNNTSSVCGAFFNGYYFQSLFKNNTNSSYSSGRYGYLYSCVLDGNGGTTASHDFLQMDAVVNCTVINHDNASFPVISGRSASSLIANSILFDNANNTIATSTNLHSNYTNDPSFYEEGSYKLASDSPCVDAGEDTYSTGSYDYYGLSRIYGLSVDIGASEYHPPSSPTTSSGDSKKEQLLKLIWR